MADFPDCTLMAGKMRSACVAVNKQAGYDEHGKKIAGSQIPPSSGSGGSTFFGIPLPGSDWWRHFIFRIAEVIVGVGMVVVGVKAFATSGDTTKVIVSGAKKVGKAI